MKKLLLFLLVLYAPNISKGITTTYAELLCQDPITYNCLTVEERLSQVCAELQINPHEQFNSLTWEFLWPDDREREIILKVNRINIKPYRELLLAIPRIMANLTYYDFSPFPFIIDPPLEPVLIWDPSLLAWGAYGIEGALLNWGPAVGGKDYCPDIGRSCRTKTGEFRILRKEGRYYHSKSYPVGCSGKNCAPMPYAVFFAPYYAFHAGTLPGKNASHGCVRVLYEDAQWLSEIFVQIGTKVIIREYPNLR